MKALENRTLNSRREMDILADIEELRIIRGQQDKFGAESALKIIRNRKEIEELVYNQEEYKRMLEEKTRHIKRLSKKADLEWNIRNHTAKTCKDNNENYSQTNIANNNNRKILKPIITVKKA